jgi:hypothetical protein
MQVFTVTKNGGKVKAFPGATFALDFQDHQHVLTPLPEPQPGEIRGWSRPEPPQNGHHVIICNSLLANSLVVSGINMSPYGGYGKTEMKATILEASVVFCDDAKEKTLVPAQTDPNENHKGAMRALVWLPGSVSIPDHSLNRYDQLMPGLIVLAQGRKLKVVLTKKMQSPGGIWLDQEVDSFTIEFNGKRVVVVDGPSAMIATYR